MPTQGPRDLSCGRCVLLFRSQEMRNEYSSLFQILDPLKHRLARNIGLRIPNFEQLIKKLRVNVKGPMVTSLTGQLRRFL